MDRYADELSAILNLLKENPRGMSVSDIAARIEVNRNTVSRYLDILRVTGQVEMKTYGKAKVYFISQRAPISAMLNFSSDMVAVTDSSFTIIEVNDALCRLLNTPREEIVGKEIRNSALAGFDHPVINERMKAALDGKETSDEINIVRAGEERNYKIKIIPTLLSDSSPGITLILEDNTDEKRANEALLKSEHNFRSLVEEINDALWDLNDAGEFIYASPRTYDILGYAPEKVAGKSFCDFAHKDSLSDINAAIRKVKSEHEPVLLECTLIKTTEKNGIRGASEVRTELSISPRLDEIGYLTGFRIVGRDISARVNAAKGLFKWKSFLSSIVDNILSMIIVKEVRGGTYIHFNRQAEEFFGITEGTSVGKMGCELFRDSVTEFFASGDKEVVRTLKPYAMPDFEVKHGDESRILKVRKVPIFGINNELEYILTIADDVTDEKKARSELIARNTRAQSYLDVAGVMIAVISTDGTIESINKTGCEILGYDEEELIGADWFSKIAPASSNTRLRKRFDDAVKGRVELRSGLCGKLRRKDGTLINVIWNNTLLKTPDGRVTAMVTSASKTD